MLAHETDAETEAPILWPLDAKSQLIGRDPGAGEDWRQEEKGVTKDEMVGKYHWLDGRGFEQTPGDSEGQGSLLCCGSRGCKHDLETEQQEQQIEQWQEGSVEPFGPRLSACSLNGPGSPEEPWHPAADRERQDESQIPMLEGRRHQLTR